MKAYLRCGLLALAVAVNGALAATLTRTSAFEYDPATGLLVKEIIEPDNSSLCLVTTYTYDAHGNKTGATTRNCNGSSSEAPAPTGDPVFTSRTTASTFAAGSTVIAGVTYTWSAGQFPTTATNALGHQEQKEYDPRFGTLAKLTGPNGLVTSWTYDSFGRKKTETRADGTVTTWTYSIWGTGYEVREDTTGAPTRFTYYDSLNREILRETLSFSGTDYVDVVTDYDSLGRVLQVSKPYHHYAQTPVWTTYAYDILGRVIRVDEPTVNGNVLRTRTDYNGLTTTVTVSNADSGSNMPGGVVQTKTTRKNSQGQVDLVTDTQGNTISYSYDPFGNLLTTNAGGVITTLGYDLRGRKTSMADPDMGSWTYAYNALGELIRQTDAKAQTVSMAYDVLGRMTSRNEPDLVSTWTYDSCIKGVGKLCSVSATNGYSRTYSYDSLGRPSSLSTSIDVAYSVSTTYDTAGRVDTVTYPTGYAVKNVYNAYGYLWKVQRTNDPDATVYWTANTQNAAGQVTSELLGNGLTTSRNYDTLFRLIGATSGTVHNLSYNYDTVGNVTVRQDLTQGVTDNFLYDSLNRLLSASGRSFNYDAIGNVTYKSDVGTYTYPTTGQRHAVSSVSGGGAANSVTATYGYDANGNVTSASGTIYPSSGSVSFSRSLAYTSYNMPSTLTHVQGGSTYSYTYTYNAEHERVKLVTSRPDGTFTSIYVHPGGKGALLYEKEIRASDGRLEHKHYVNGGAGVIGVFVTKSVYASGEGPEMRYYHRDHLGSVAVITNPSGAVIERFAYEAFGERRYPNGTAENRASPLIGVTTDRGYTAHEHLDEMMLIHMNGRIYDPIIARFVTADPLIPSPSNLQDYNRYSYVNNNPLGYTDPTGYSRLSRLKDKIGHEASSAWKTVWRSELGQATIQIAVASYGGPWGSAAYNVAYTKYKGGDWNDAFRNGAIAFATVSAYQLLGDQPWYIKVPGSAAVGCGSAAASGGDCQSGAVSGGAGAAATYLPMPQGVPAIVVVATIGGTVSSISGGKFGNGAVTASFAYLFSGSGSNTSGDRVQVACAPACTGVYPAAPPAFQVQAQNSLAVQLTQALDAVGDFFGYIFKSDSVVLGRNLTEAGYVRDDFQHAHHIVASGAAAAAPARAVLAGVGMDINSAFNGMFIDASYHSSLHTGRYYANVNLFLSGATTQADVASRLTLIRGMINTRTFPY